MSSCSIISNTCTSMATLVRATAAGSAGGAIAACVCKLGNVILRAGQEHTHNLPLKELVQASVVGTSIVSAGITALNIAVIDPLSKKCFQRGGDDPLNSNFSLMNRLSQKLPQSPCIRATAKIALSCIGSASVSALTICASKIGNEILKSSRETQVDLPFKDLIVSGLVGGSVLFTAPATLLILLMASCAALGRIAASHHLHQVRDIEMN